MNHREIHLSKEFKTQAVKAVAAVVFFVLSYAVILLFALLLTGLCIVAGITLVVIKPMFITLAFGIGLASLGILILIFLLKFIFKSHKTDRSQLVEINRQQEPELFKMIGEIVALTGTNHPKKVYLSSDVNAAVFYDSTIRSMFMPVRKNLIIGLGLVNTVTKEELKAILSHEFGHFSQRTMKVGSYVYNVNQVIFNLLFDNESYESLVQRWANMSGYFSIFVVLAGKINTGIQWVLKKLYTVVNKNYLGLSREMEFHADEIAASVTGYEPLKKSLLRMSLADNSFDTVLNFYNSKISDNIKSENIYKDQSLMLNFLAESSNISISNNLPDIALEEQSKYNKSKLIIKDQWASHPTVEERIKRLESTGFTAEKNCDVLANSLFSDIAMLQQQLTDTLFDELNFEGETKLMNSADFLENYKNENATVQFPTLYNGYYSNKHPVGIDLQGELNPEDTLNVEELFSDEQVDLVYTAIALQNDLTTLTEIAEKKYMVKTYDYNGVRYKGNQSGELVKKLTPELDHLNARIKSNDQRIFNFFIRKETALNKPQKLTQLYRHFDEFDKKFDADYAIYTQLLSELEFVNITTPFEKIKSNFKNIKATEAVLKQEIAQLLTDSYLESEIPDAMKENFEHYLSQSLEYFGGVSYFDENLNIFYTALHHFGYLLSRKYFLMKKELLVYQEELV